MKVLINYDDGTPLPVLERTRSPLNCWVRKMLHESLVEDYEMGLHEE
jgi:hypothetical protein